MVRPPIVFAFQGSSLTTGRLSADWVPRLTNTLQTYPEAVGPISVLNMGKGSQTSVWGVSNAPFVSVLRPTHIITEGFAINDCFDSGSGPQVSRPDHIANIQAMVAEWQANDPGVDITIQTMSSISASIASGRPQLATYYADEVATAQALGVRWIDNYANWPTPLNSALTYNADGLHPIWTGAVDTYYYPTILAFCRARMAEFWPA